MISPTGPVGSVIALAAILYAIALVGVMLAAAAGMFGFPVHVAEIPAALGAWDARPGGVRRRSGYDERGG